MAPASFTVREIVVSRVGPHGTVPRDLDAHSVAVALTGDQGPEVVLAELEAGAAPRAAAATPHDPGNSVGVGGVQRDPAVAGGATNAAAHQGVVGTADRQFPSPNGGWCGVLVVHSVLPAVAFATRTLQGWSCPRAAKANTLALNATDTDHTALAPQRLQARRGPPSHGYR